MNFWSIVSILCLLIPVRLAPPLHALQVENNMDQLIRQSTFIFVGTVEKLNATTMKSVKASEATAVVRLDKLIEAPGAPPDLAGKSITVQVRQPSSLRVGQQATFFTKGWLLGNSMAVIEMGHCWSRKCNQCTSRWARSISRWRTRSCRAKWPRPWRS